MALAPGLVLVWPCPRASSCRVSGDNNNLPQATVAQRRWSNWLPEKQPSRPRCTCTYRRDGRNGYRLQMHHHSDWLSATDSCWRLTASANSANSGGREGKGGDVTRGRRRCQMSRGCLTVAKTSRSALKDIKKETSEKVSRTTFFELCLLEQNKTFEE